MRIPPHMVFALGNTSVGKLATFFDIPLLDDAQLLADAVAAHIEQEPLMGLPLESFALMFAASGITAPAVLTVRNYASAYSAWKKEAIGLAEQAAVERQAMELELKALRATAAGGGKPTPRSGSSGGTTSTTSAGQLRSATTELLEIEEVPATTVVTGMQDGGTGWAHLADVMTGNTLPVTILRTPLPLGAAPSRLSRALITISLDRFTSMQQLLGGNDSASIIGGGDTDPRKPGTAIFIAGLAFSLRHAVEEVGRSVGGLNISFKASMTASKTLSISLASASTIGDGRNVGSLARALAERAAEVFESAEMRMALPSLYAKYDSARIVARGALAALTEHLVQVTRLHESRQAAAIVESTVISLLFLGETPVYRPGSSSAMLAAINILSNLPSFSAPTKRDLEDREDPPDKSSAADKTKDRGKKIIVDTPYCADNRATVISGTVCAHHGVGNESNKHATEDCRLKLGSTHPFAIWWRTPGMGLGKTIPKAGQSFNTANKGA